MKSPHFCYLFSSYYGQLNRFCLKLMRLWTVTVFKHAFSCSHVCSYHAVHHQGLGSHYIIISISRAIKHPPSVFIVIHLTNILQSMDLRPGKAAEFGSNLWGSWSLFYTLQFKKGHSTHFSFLFTRIYNVFFCSEIQLSEVWRNNPKDVTMMSSGLFRPQAWGLKFLTVCYKLEVWGQRKREFKRKGGPNEKHCQAALWEM